MGVVAGESVGEHVIEGEEMGVGDDGAEGDVWDRAGDAGEGEGVAVGVGECVGEDTEDWGVLGRDYMLLDRPMPDVVVM